MCDLHTYVYFDKFFNFLVRTGCPLLELATGRNERTFFYFSWRNLKYRCGNIAGNPGKQVQVSARRRPIHGGIPVPPLLKSDLCVGERKRGLSNPTTNEELSFVRLFTVVKGLTLTIIR